jgi:diketogulonate reductase-like aldo/keto reductase
MKNMLWVSTLVGEKEMINNNTLPRILYGTAWKEGETEALVTKAINAGFTGIDTANQRKHYYEEAVGKAIKKAINEKKITREQLFLQTKFTYLAGQDHRLPYDHDADPETQVHQSFVSSLLHLQTEYVDSYILHGPQTSHGLTETDWIVWKKMEALQKTGKTKYLGISNVTFDQLKELFTKAMIKPTFVQNRCFANTAWDREIRTFCKDNNIIYQGFSLLTANAYVLNNQQLKEIILKSGKTAAQVLFRFAMQVGMIPLTGTTNETHMKQDLSCTNFSLSDEEVTFIENMCTRYSKSD